MTRSPIFIVREQKPYYISFNADFQWNGGFAKSQKQKNIKALHESYQRIHPGAKLLEISSASL